MLAEGRGPHGRTAFRSRVMATLVWEGGRNQDAHARTEPAGAALSLELPHPQQWAAFCPVHCLVVSAIPEGSIASITAWLLEKARWELARWFAETDEPRMLSTEATTHGPCAHVIQKCGHLPRLVSYFARMGRTRPCYARHRPLGDLAETRCSLNADFRQISGRVVTSSWLEGRWSLPFSLRQVDVWVAFSS